MSIALSLRFTRHAWAMPPVPGLPTGVWSASGDDEGDASGGIISFQHIFRNAGNNIGDNQLYNIEHVMGTVQDFAQDAMMLTINGMDPGTGQVATPLPVDRRYQFPLLDADVGAGFVQAVPPTLGTVPIWVGTYSGLDTDLGDMIIATENIDGSRFIVVVYGYYWAPASVNAPGGIQRPPNGLWRS